MHDEQRAELGGLGESRIKPERVKPGELGHPGVGEERLEAEHPGLVQPGQVAQVAGHHATPETHVHVRGRPGGGLLFRERGGRGRRRQAVQRHVDQRGHPARSGGPCRGREALPLGAARLVDVHVGVHQPGQQHLGTGQFHGLDRVQGLPGARDRGDLPVADADRCRAHPVRGDHPFRPDHQFVLSHARSLPTRRPRNPRCRHGRCLALDDPHPEGLWSLAPTPTQECGRWRNRPQTPRASRRNSSHHRTSCRVSPAQCRALMSWAGPTITEECGWSAHHHKRRLHGGRPGSHAMTPASHGRRLRRHDVGSGSRWLVCRWRGRGKGVTCPALPT